MPQRLALAAAVGLLALAPSVRAQPDDIAYCQDMAATGHLQSCTMLYSYRRGTSIRFGKGNNWSNILDELDALTGDRDLAPAILVTAVADPCP